MKTLPHPINSVQSEAIGSFTPTLSIVMPVYNEKSHLETIIDRIRAVEISHELIVINDGSTDGTRNLLDKWAQIPRVVVVQHSSNHGKGAALRTGFARVQGDIVIVQDGDLEYDPADYRRIIAPILSGAADVVYGSRFLEPTWVEMPRVTFWANRLITWLFNRATGLRLTDVETCYKAFRRETLQRVLPMLSEDRFGIEIELSARLASLSGIRLTEVPVHYQARGRRDGKKLRFRDGVRALWCIASIGDAVMPTATPILAKKAIRKTRFGWLEICLLLSVIALVVQCIGPDVLRMCREWPRPGQQTPGSTVVGTADVPHECMQYLAYLPDDYSARQRFPLLVFLHGSGQRGNDLELLKKSGPPKFLSEGKSLPMIVVSPQCPAGAIWETGSLLALLDVLEKEFSVDSDRIYIAGFSMGGFGAWDLIAAAPDRFAAAVPVAGGGKAEKIQRSLQMPIWAFHGAKDEGVPLGASEQMVKAVRSQGGDARLTVYEDKGHGICDCVFSRDDVYEWLLQQHRRRK